MEDRIFICKELKEALELIGAEADTTEECTLKVQDALKITGEKLHLGRVEALIAAPKTKLRPEGKQLNYLLYDSPKTDEGRSREQIYTLSDGGKVCFRFSPAGGAAFSPEDENILQLLLHEIYTQYSRTIMKSLLNTVITTDMSTGVSNQSAFIRHVAQLLARRELAQYEITFFNIHNFKYVNKVFAYEQGDFILKNYAQKIKEELNGEELLARLGGDNFVMLYRRERREELTSFIQNVHITHTHNLMEKEFWFSATMGISTLENISRPQDVMARVSIAYQAARQKGVGSIAIFSPEIEKKILENQSVISNFLPALEKEEFVVYYQPKVNIADKTIYGAEALVRWLRYGTLIAPARFIPQLEREGSICKLDFYVLKKVCAFLRDRLDKGKKVVPVSINFSRKHLEEEGLVKRILDIVDTYGIAHNLLEIEFTESDDFQDYEIMSGAINELKENGLGTSLDDFGTGFSSLNMIKNVELNVIKIDKSFIPLETMYPGKERDLMMFQSIVTLINKLGRKTVVEGVETVNQLEYLRQVGCEIVQGYVFDRPLPEEIFKARLDEEHPYK